MILVELFAPFVVRLEPSHISAAHSARSSSRPIGLANLEQMLLLLEETETAKDLVSIDADGVVP